MKMNRTKNILGFTALAAIVAALNVLVFRQNPFLPSVVVPFMGGLAAGLVWVILSLITVAKSASPEKKALYGLNTVAVSVLFLGICVVIYAFFQHKDKSWDLTQEGRRQLAPQTVQVLKNLNKDVSVIAFFLRIDDELVNIAREKTERFLDQCVERTSRLKVEFLDPQTDVTRLTGLNVTHYSTQGTIVIKCGTNQKVITLAGATPRLEEREFINGIINVIRDSQPKICFLTGHGERSIDSTDEKNGASRLKELLEAESYRTEKISISIANPEIPSDCDILVINGLGLQGPQSDLHPEEVRAMQAFLDCGGRLLVMVDPWRRVVAADNQMEQLLPWLEKRYGIIVPNSIALTPRSKQPWLAELVADPMLFNDKERQTDFWGCFNGSHPITRGTDQKMLFSVARSVRLAEKMPDQVTGTELLRTIPDSYLETDVAGLMTSGKAGYNPGEQEGPLPLAVAVTAKTSYQAGDSGKTRDARIVVVGDSEFASNAQLPVIPGNFNFMLNTMAWLSESEELIAIRSSGKEEAPILLSAGDQKIIVYVAVLGTIQLVIAAGLTACIVRRKYQ